MIAPAQPSLFPFTRAGDRVLARLGAAAGAQAPLPGPLGQPAATEPLSPYYGLDRGLPSTGFYIEGFLAGMRRTSAAVARGARRELHAALRCRPGRRQRGPRYRRDDPRRRSSRISPSPARSGRPLRLCDPHADAPVSEGPGDWALRTVWESLAPRGTALITVPSLSRIDPDQPGDRPLALHGSGLQTLLARACSGTDVTRGHRATGNVLVGVRLPHGHGRGGPE